MEDLLPAGALADAVDSGHVWQTTDYDWATDGSDAVLPSAVRLLAIPVPVQPAGVSTLVLTAKTGWARRVQHPRKCGSNTCISGSGSAIADGVTAATVGVVWLAVPVVPRRLALTVMAVRPRQLCVHCRRTRSP